MRRVTRAQKFLFGKPAMDFLHFILFEFLSADGQTHQKGGKFHVTHVAEDDLTRWIVFICEGAKERVELPW